MKISFSAWDDSKPRADILRYLVVMLLFAIAGGAFASILNNFLFEKAGMDHALARGVLEFFREMPGLLLVAILAFASRRDEWWILRAGLIVAAAGAAGLLFEQENKVLVTALIMVWSLGEHVLMPVRNSITLHFARSGSEGSALGAVAGLGNLGGVAGAAMVAALFYALKRYAPQQNGYSWTFGIIVALVCAGLFAAWRVVSKGGQVKRPRMLFRRKFSKFYALEIFYGARKQVFFTFAPYVLIMEHKMDTEHFALLAGICGAANIFCGPIAGKIIDRLGYRTVMIWDTVFLTFVCLMYGFADRVFAPNVAFTLLCVNYLLDAIITNASMASNVYVKELSDNREEFTSTLSTGISVNHLISILVALFGGWVWKNFGVEALFTFSATMAIGNTLFAITIPKKVGNGNMA